MIYFISNGLGHVKIGYSETNPSNRLKAGQTWNSTPLTLLGVMRGDQFLEQTLHERFERHQIQGEWFDLTPEICSYIARHTCDFR